jgi:Zn-dependent protease
MRSIRIGKIAGFEISIDWSWLIVFFLVVYSLAGFYFPNNPPRLGVGMSWLVALASALLLFASVLAHELMHSVVARRYGLEIKGITLFIFGGVSQTKGEPETPKIEFWMAIAGPATSFALAAAFYGLAYTSMTSNWPAAVVALTSYLALINFMLGVFNLVPGFPLDGGRVLRSALWGWTNDLTRATRYASYTGQAFAYLLIGFGLLSVFRGALMSGIWLGFIGWFLLGAAKSSYEQVLMRQALSDVEVERVMTTEVPTVTPEVTVDDFVNNYLMKQEYACYPVVEGEHVDGVVSIEEVRGVPREQWSTTKLGEIAQPVDDEIRVSKDDNAWDALLKLASEDTRRLLVMHNGTLDGTVTQENILRLVRTRMQLGVYIAVGRESRPPRSLPAIYHGRAAQTTADRSPRIVGSAVRSTRESRGRLGTVGRRRPALPDPQVARSCRNAP